MKRQGELGLSFLCCIPVVREGGNIIRGPKEACAEFVELRDAAQEMIGVLYLNAKNGLLDKRIISVGISDSCSIHPRELFRWAILALAKSVILCHNHPSGDPTPSAEDLRITRQMVESGRVLGIRVVDHIIIGRPSAPNGRDFFSVKEGGLCDFD